MTTPLTGNNNANLFAVNPPANNNNFAITDTSEVSISALGGNDTVDLTGVGGGSVSQFTVAAGEGQDLIQIIDATESVFYAGLGNDTINAFGTVETSLIQSSQGGNNVFGLNAVSNSSVTAGDGNDNISFGANVSDSTVAAGAGNDDVVFSADLVGSTVYLGAGTDSIEVLGAVSSSFIQSGSGANLFELSNGDFASSSLNGGTGNDVVELANVNSSIIATGDGNDDIEADDLTSSTVYAGAGNDVVSVDGDITNSLIQSGSGNNRFEFDADKDFQNVTLNGGVGNDVIAFINTNAGDTADFFDGTSISNIATVVAEDGVDITLGEEAEDAGIRSAISESETGGLVIDASAYTVGIALTAGEDNDTLIGGEGADTITGGIGANLFIGGAGNDIITGGGGGNTFNFADILISGTAGTVAAVRASVGTDTITNFVVADDLFTLEQAVFGVALVANVPLDTNNFITQEGTGALGNGATAFDTDGGIVFDETSRIVYFVEAATGMTTTTTLQSLVNAGEAVQIARITNLTGTLSEAAFTIA